MLIRIVVCVAMAGARIGELAYSRRNLATAGRTTEGSWSQRTYPLIVAVHSYTILNTLIRGGKVRPSWLALLLAVQPLRAWVLATLGHRWNARAAVPEAMAVETGGPYAYVRHPNYSIIALELLALPLAFRQRKLALTVSLANAALIGLRLREEEAALEALPGYREHFGEKKRFIPRVW